MPTSGFVWVRNSIPLITKMLMHEWYSSELLRKGLTEEEIIQRPSAMPAIRHARGDALFADYVDHMVPEFKPYFEEHSTDRKYGDYGRALTSRTTNSIRLGEMRQFREGVEWKPIRSLVLNAIKTGTPIDTLSRYTAHETLVLNMVRGKPGVYLNVAPNDRSWFYLGESADIGSRHNGHRNGDLFMVRAYLTADKQTAVHLQNALYQQLERMDAEHRVIQAKRIVDGKTARWGATKLDDGINSLELFDGFVSTYYKEWCRAKVGATC